LNVDRTQRPNQTPSTHNLSEISKPVWPIQV
jgi:hypothetical protein